MSTETVVIEELRNLDGDRFRVTVWTSAGKVHATLILAEDVPPPSHWTVGDWGRLVSEIVDERPEGSMELTTLLQPVAYRMGLAAFVTVSDDDDGEDVRRDSAWVAGRSATGVSVSVIGGTPIPAKVYAHEGAGDDDTPYRAWAAEIEDITPFVADALARTLRSRRALAVDSTIRATGALNKRFGMKFRIPPDPA